MRFLGVYLTILDAYVASMASFETFWYSDLFLPSSIDFKLPVLLPFPIFYIFLKVVACYHQTFDLSLKIFSRKLVVRQGVGKEIFPCRL